MNYDWIVSLTLRVLYTKKIQMCSICRDSIAWRTNNGCTIVLRRHAYQQWSAIDQTWYFGALQSKQLSTNDSAVFDLDAVMFICAERWSQIHGIRTLSKLTVGDVHRTLCKQKKTSALCATNGERNTSNRLWTSLLQQMRLEHFEIISSVSIST